MDRCLEYARQTSDSSPPSRVGYWSSVNVRGESMEVIHTRYAGIDISKKNAKVGVRVKDPNRTESSSKITTWSTVTN